LRYVDTPQGLEEAVHRLRDAPWASVDTEADSLHHYIEKLCLVQVSVPGEDYVIDPLARGMEFGPMNAVLAARPLNLHGADFDIRMLKRAATFQPSEIFDTNIAAQLLGYDGQGYASLVERHCGVKLLKTSQKADWSRRPLDAKMLDYAWKDTHYLGPIREVIEGELRQLGRLEWHRQSCQKLLKTLAAPPLPRESDGREWQIKGSKELTGQALTALKELWHWRDEEARRRDRPSFKVLNTDVLLDLAKWTAAHPGADVGQMPKAPSNVRGDLRDRLNAVVRRAAEGPQAVWDSGPKPAERKRWRNEDAERFVKLKTERQELGQEHKLHPSLFGTNAALEVIASKNPRTLEDLSRLECLMSWQVDVAGERYLKAVAPRAK